VSRLALSMIVRNAEELLPACLESVRGVVDEIVVADTGSRDQTISAAKKFGARVISIPWTNDFAAARNQALAEVNCDWVLVLDADEQLDGTAAQEIPTLLANNPADAYQVTIRNYVLSFADRIWDRTAKSNDSRLPAAGAYPAYVEQEDVRLFRHDPEVYFVGRVQESVGPRILHTKRKIDRAPFCIHHFGLVADAETRARKNHFYRRLGREKLQDMPQDAQAYLELGVLELDHFGNLAEALALFERACQLDSHCGVAWFFQGLALVKLQRLREALQCLSEAEQQGHITSLVYETQADAYDQLKQYPEACESYDRALRCDPGNPLLESKLGLAIVRTGNMERGLCLIQQAIQVNPAAGELHDRLILSLVWLNRIEEAGAAADAKLGAIENPQAVDFLRAASLWAKEKKWSRAGAVLQAGLQAFPNDMTLGRSITEVTQIENVSKYATTAKSNDSQG
jgi:tetratricopeptide (TPR) repeat protein